MPAFAGHTTQRADFPHCAPPFASRQSLWDEVPSLHRRYPASAVLRTSPGISTVRDRVCGSAGGANKCAFLRHIGVDHVIDYKATSNLTDALLRAAPNGIDVYFDNVGGNHLEAALATANRFARFVLCGMISQYNTVGLPEGPRNIMFVIGKCIRLEGLDVANYFNLLPEFHRDLSGWIRDGKLVWKESVEKGIENAPTAFLKLFEGENFGKMLVKLA